MQRAILLIIFTITLTCAGVMPARADDHVIRGFGGYPEIPGATRQGNLVVSNNYNSFGDDDPTPSPLLSTDILRTGNNAHAWMRTPIYDAEITNVSFWVLTNTQGTATHYAEWFDIDGTFISIESAITPPKITPEFIELNAPAGAYQVRVGVKHNLNSFQAAARIGIVRIYSQTTPETTPELMRPLTPSVLIAITQAGDIETNESFGVPEPNGFATIHWANGVSRVHAVTSGTVQAILPLDRALCAELRQSQFAGVAFLNARCLLYGNEVFLPNEQNMINVGDYSQVTVPGVFVVVIVSDGYEYLQLVSDWQGYVSVGDEINAGCVLGSTIKPPDIDISFLSLFGLGGRIASFLTPPQADVHFTGVWARNGDGYHDAFDWFVSSPSETAAPCNASEGFSGCLGDARMLNSSQYQYNLSAEPFPTGGFTLSSGGFVRQTMVLNSALEPELIVNVTTLEGEVNNQLISMRLGTTTETNVPIIGNDTVGIDGGAHTPDVNDLYTVEARNTGTGIFRVNYLCVRLTKDAGGEPIVYPAEPPTEFEPPGASEGTIFYPSCNLIEDMGASPDIGVAIAWHWSHLSNFFECELMVILNKMHTLQRDSFRAWGYSTRWFMASVGLFAGYIGGYFDNLIASLAPVTVNEQCNNIFCLLESLITNILAPILDLFMWIIENVIFLAFSVVLMLIETIINLFSTLFELITVIIGAIIGLIDAYVNATPVAIDGLPNCDVEPSSAICAFYWTLEETILTENGQYFTPIISIWLSIHLLLFAIHRLYRGLSNAGNAI